MNTLESIFPAAPTYKGVWHAIYLEPIVGSGERVTVAVAAIGESAEFNVIQAIRGEILDCLYGVQAQNIQNMIGWIMQSASKHIKNNNSLNGWASPFDGVICTGPVAASDGNIDGILRQAIRFSASLSALSLDADRDADEQQSKRYASRWSANIADELKVINPNLLPYFRQKIQIGDSGIQTTLGFLSDRYVSNFALLVPTNISSSLTSIKAKLLDLEVFKKSSYLIKPERYEIIIGTPSLNDQALSDKVILNLKNNIELINEIADQESISVFSTDNANVAAQHINTFAA